MASRFPISEHVAKSARHTTFYLACGAPEATPIIFLHGWPELSISWRHQLPVFGALGLRAIAPDMRGYGRSSVYSRHEDYAQEPVVEDMLELLDSLGAQRAIWVGHDWGSPVVWNLAQHHPERCHGVASLCVPYEPRCFAAEYAIECADRAVYPEAEFPAAQWDYQLYYREHFDKAVAGFEANTRATVKLFFRAGNEDHQGKPAPTAFTRRNGGWFGPDNTAPDLPRDERILTQEDEDSYTAALKRNGFFGPDSWYMNKAKNDDYAERARQHWTLKMPVLFLHAKYDFVCETLQSSLAEPMRKHCTQLSEAVVASGHWMAQEKPAEVNAHLARWLATELPDAWKTGGDND
ncbi:MAG: alpha/beta hydrolase [Myxococcales bacterium]|nr:alpha/beta hydrolase [Myxococcales bacterium]MDD9970841.1 alpha/beta hydrolase [Myxococcales bacterium]